jgi:glycine/D-amino acid oxidase-like deaminating enzyme
MAAAWEVIIVGGGLAGSALAASLSRAGRRVLLLEAATVGGGGATAHSRGIVRLYDPQWPLMKKSAAGVRSWQQIARRHPSVFTAGGMLYLLRPENISAAREAVAAFHQADYPLHLLALPEILARQPSLAAADLPAETQAVWEPAGGYVNPRLAAQLLAEEARQAGAVVLEGSTVQRLTEQLGTVTVTTANGTLQARTLVLATGAATRALCPASRIFSRTIPLGCVHSPAAAMPPHTLIDENSGGYLRPESAAFGFVGGAPQYDAAQPAALNWQPEEAAACHRQLVQRFLGEGAVQVVDGRNGYDGYTPDNLPETCYLPGSRIALFSGFSGRGAKYIPAAAEAFSKLVEARLR